MNLEEARNNIGAEVELDESTKPYTWLINGLICEINEKVGRNLKIFFCSKDGNVVTVDDDGFTFILLPHHLKLKPQTKGTFKDLEPRKEMTWEDALRAVADGRKVEFYNKLCQQWWDISHLSATEVIRIEKFRIAPKRIYLHGNYTNEELLKEIGEMECPLHAQNLHTIF